MVAKRTKRRKTVSRKNLRKTVSRKNLRRKTVSRKNLRKTVSRKKLRRKTLRKKNRGGGFFDRICAPGGCVDDSFSQILDAQEAVIPDDQEAAKPDALVYLKHEEYNPPDGDAALYFDETLTNEQRTKAEPILMKCIEQFINIISRIYLLYHCPGRNLFNTNDNCDMKCGGKEYEDCNKLCCEYENKKCFNRRYIGPYLNMYLQIMTGIAREVMEKFAVEHPGAGFDIILKNAGYPILSSLLCKIIIAMSNQEERGEDFDALNIMYIIPTGTRNGHRPLGMRNNYIPLDGDNSKGVVNTIIYLIWESLNTETCWKNSEIFKFFAFYESMRERGVDGRSNIGPL